MSKKFKMADVKPGKVVSFDGDAGSYRILVQEVNGSKVKGVVLYFDSYYSSACYPPSIIPTVYVEEYDLKHKEECIDEDSIRIKDATMDEIYYAADAKKAQTEFLKRMVPYEHKHVYQEITFSITRVENQETFTLCDMRIQNICGLNKDGEYKNPYVVDRKFYADTFEKMKEAYDTYGSAKGALIPETIIRFTISYVEKNGHIKEICSVSVPYSVLKEKQLEIFPIKLDDAYMEKIQNGLKFLELAENTK